MSAILVVRAPTRPPLAMKDSNPARWLHALTLLAAAMASCAPPDEPPGPHVHLSFDPAPRVGEVLCTVLLHDGDGAPLDAEHLEIESGLDRAGFAPFAAEPERLAPGVFRTPLRFHREGDWLVVVSAVLAGGQSLVSAHAVPAVRRERPRPPLGAGRPLCKRLGPAGQLD